MQTFPLPLTCGGELLTEATTAATFAPIAEAPPFFGRVSESSARTGSSPSSSGGKAQEAFLRFCTGKRLLPKHFLTSQPGWSKSRHVRSLLDLRLRRRGQGRYRPRVSHWADSQYSYTRTDHFLLQRGGGLQCRGVPVDGSQKMDNTWMEAIEPYDYTQAVPFDMAYLSGYLADQYDVSSGRASPLPTPGSGHGGAMLAGTTPGFATVVPESKFVQVHGGQVQYMLLPVWVLHATYDGRSYTFMMNGQTGKLVGELPISRGRSWAWFGAVCGGVTAAATLAGLLFRLL